MDPNAAITIEAGSQMSGDIGENIVNDIDFYFAGENTVYLPKSYLNALPNKQLLFVRDFISNNEINFIGGKN